MCSRGLFLQNHDMSPGVAPWEASLCDRYSAWCRPRLFHLFAPMQLVLARTGFRGEIEFRPKITYSSLLPCSQRRAYLSVRLSGRQQRAGINVFAWRKCLD